MALAKDFKSWVAACYQYLKDNKLEAGDPQTIVATACGYVADPGKVLDIYTEVMASTDKIFLSQYRKALSSLKNMPPDTPRQNVKRALDWVLKRTPENLVRKPPSKS